MSIKLETSFFTENSNGLQFASNFIENMENSILYSPCGLNNNNNKNDWSEKQRTIVRWNWNDCPRFDLQVHLQCGFQCNLMLWNTYLKFDSVGNLNFVHRNPNRLPKGPSINLVIFLGCQIQCLPLLIGKTMY